MFNIYYRNVLYATMCVELLDPSHFLVVKDMSVKLRMENNTALSHGLQSHKLYLLLVITSYDISHRLLNFSTK